VPVPGRTNMVACNFSGRIVGFEIQEGKGNLRAHIVESGKKWSDIVPFQPVQVFDREGSGNEFFANLGARTPAGKAKLPVHKLNQACIYITARGIKKIPFGNDRGVKGQRSSFFNCLSGGAKFF